MSHNGCGGGGVGERGLFLLTILPKYIYGRTLKEGSKIVAPRFGPS